MKQIGLILLISFLFWGCEIKREALGADNEILILTSAKDQEVIGSILRRVFTDTVYTPQPEIMFELKFADPAGFKQLRRQTNLVIGSIGTDLSQANTKLVSQLLGGARFKDTIEGNEHIIFTQDQFAMNQLFMILSAGSNEQLAKAFAGKEDWIKTQFDNQLQRRQSKFLFERARRKKLETKFSRKYNWEIKIPWGWAVIRDSSDANFVWLGREMPYQWFSIHWEDGLIVKDSSEAREYEWEFPTLYYGNIQYNQYNFNISQVDFNHWTAWQITGLWESIDDSKGGPFFSYLFYDGVTDMTYHLNMLIHHPGREKNLYLRQLDLIAHTFSVE